jgi:CRP-like cAMP-binding protein
LQAILRNYASEVIKRKAEDCIFRQGQKPHGFYLINRGSVRLSMESARGQRVMERVVGEGCLVGLPATASGRAYSLTCEVVEDVELMYLSRKDFAKLMKCESEAALKLLGLLSSEVQAARREVAHSPRARSAAISIITHTRA